MRETPILAFDCATPTASVALAVGGKTHARSIEHGKQASELVPVIDALLREHGVAYAQLGAIITTLGPGSFTGLRIALATLHGLVLAVPVPVKTLTSLEAVAWGVAQRKNAPKEILVVLNAGKGEVFSQAFRIQQGKPKAEGDIAMGKLESLDTPAPQFGNMREPTDAHYIAGPSATVLCGIADQLPETHIENALPLYIRPPDVKMAKPLPWLTKEAV